jgi:hypothetical protein
MFRFLLLRLVLKSKIWSIEVLLLFERIQEVVAHDLNLGLLPKLSHEFLFLPDALHLLGLLLFFLLSKKSSLLNAFFLLVPRVN